MTQPLVPCPAPQRPSLLAWVALVVPGCVLPCPPIWVSWKAGLCCSGQLEDSLRYCIVLWVGRAGETEAQFGPLTCLGL